MSNIIQSQSSELLVVENDNLESKTTKKHSNFIKLVEQKQGELVNLNVLRISWKISKEIYYEKSKDLFDDLLSQFSRFSMWIWKRLLLSLNPNKSHEKYYLRNVWKTGYLKLKENHSILVRDFSEYFLSENIKLEDVEKLIIFMQILKNGFLVNKFNHIYRWLKCNIKYLMI